MISKKIKVFAVALVATLALPLTVSAQKTDKEIEDDYANAWDQFEKELSEKEAEEEAEEEKQNPADEKVLTNQEDDRWGDWAKEQEANKKAEDAKKEREKELEKTFDPKDASKRVEDKKMTDDPAKNEGIWADKAEELYKAYRIEDQAKYAINKLAASKEYKEALAKYKAALAREDHWDAAATKALILDMIVEQFPGADKYNAEDFASDYLELTAAANTDSKTFDVPEVNKYGNTDKDVRGEEGVKPEDKENKENKENDKKTEETKESTAEKASEKASEKAQAKSNAKTVATTGVASTALVGVASLVSALGAAYIKNRK